MNTTATTHENNQPIRPLTQQHQQHFHQVAISPSAAAHSARPLRIILLRHGESVGNVDQKAYVTTPDWKVPLTSLGEYQARKAGQELYNLIHGSSENKASQMIVYHSPYKRTTQTTEHLLTCFPSSQITSVREEPRISEQQWGNYQNEAVVRNARNERHGFGRFYYRFPSGESGLDVYSRVSSFISTLVRDCQQYHKAGYNMDQMNIVIVTHGLALRLFLMRWFQFSVQEFEQSKNPDNASLIVMDRKCVGPYKWYELDPNHREALNLPETCGKPRNVRLHHLDEEPCPHFMEEKDT